MRYLLPFIPVLSCVMHVAAQYRPDILGDGFEQRTISTIYNHTATLVRATPLCDSKIAVLYIHGYNDYFFQRQMAERFVDSLYNFYALDLHNYGRSLRPEQRPFEIGDVSEYFAEIDTALISMQSEGAERIILMGHSTGGLITALYCQENRGKGVVDALILNSPFFDMNLGSLLETIGVPIVSIIGKYKPDFEVTQSSSSAYFESLQVYYKGEWYYDENLKFRHSPPITAGWIRAIHRAHNQVQRGLDIDIPVMLLYSDKSVNSSEWVPEYQCSDAVLDVADIKKYGSNIGKNVTHCEVKDGMHDIILSGYESREFAYNAIFAWLKNVVAEK